jgi:hypothetical protein
VLDDEPRSSSYAPHHSKSKIQHSHNGRSRWFIHFSLALMVTFLMLFSLSLSSTTLCSPPWKFVTFNIDNSVGCVWTAMGNMVHPSMQWANLISTPWSCY